MMTIKSILTLTLLFTASTSMAECVNPPAPTMPEGASATMEDMIAGQGAVKTFQADNISYMECLEKSFTAAEADSEEGTDEEKAAATAVYDKALADYNNAVSNEEEVAGKFNTAIRAFKEANPS